MRKLWGAPLSAAALLLGACAHGRPAHVPREQGGGAATRLEVPFFPDRTDQCGPSALASVLSYWGAGVSPAALKAAAYTPRLRGSLAIDLLLAARSRGMRAEAFVGSLERLKAELDEGRPVIAFINRGWRAVPIGHFLVVTGYDDARRVVTAHSGAKNAAAIPYKKFSAAWDKTGRWALLVLPPDGPQGWLAFGNAAFGEGRLSEAESAFRTALAASPGHVGASNNLAMTLLAAGGDLIEAARLAEGVLAEAGPLRPYVLDTLAQIALKQAEAAKP